jgi:hypothetical protein
VNKDNKKELLQKLFEEELVCNIIPQTPKIKNQSHDEVGRQSAYIKKI